jgi:hydrogenase expression/formation protein HypC
MSDHCITCGDDGVPMRVVRIDAERSLALCEAEDGDRSSVEITLVDAEPGDTLLVHAGTALARLDLGRADAALAIDARGRMPRGGTCS